MAIKIFETVKTKRITRVFLSDDWNTITPWQHKGKKVPYFFSYIREKSTSGDVDFLYLYIGPLAILSGKWIREEGNNA